MSLPNAVLSHDTMPSLGWQITLACVLKVSGGLSTLGSLCIITEVLRSAKHRKSPFRRLMLGMSISDALCSSWIFLSSWALPEGYWWGAVGNRGTCSAQGFFIHLSLAVPVYNASLSVYYMLKIKYNWRDEQFAKKAEPWVHLIANGNAIIYTVIAISIGMYHPTGPLCLESYDPKVCNPADLSQASDECKFQIKWSNIFTTWWYTVVFLGMFVAGFAMFFVYRTVRAMEIKMEKYDFRLQASAAVAASAATTTTHSTTTATPTTGAAAAVRVPPSSNKSSTMSNNNNNKPSVRSILFAEALSASKNKENSSARKEKEENAAARTLRREQERDRTKKSRRVAKVGFYYLAVFLVSWLPTFTAECILARVMANHEVSETAWYVLFLIVFFVWPAQGFFNFLVYYYRGGKSRNNSGDRAISSKHKLWTSSSALINAATTTLSRKKSRQGSRSTASHAPATSIPPPLERDEIRSCNGSS